MIIFSAFKSYVFAFFQSSSSFSSYAFLLWSLDPLIKLPNSLSKWALQASGSGLGQELLRVVHLPSTLSERKRLLCMLKDISAVLINRASNGTFFITLDFFLFLNFSWIRFWQESIGSELLGTLRNHDGNANENVIWKCKFVFILVLFCTYSNSFNFYNVAEQNRWRRSSS